MTLSRLKQATVARHAAIESHPVPLGPGLSRAAYRAGLHTGDRTRTPQPAQDLAALGVTADEQDQPWADVEIDAKLRLRLLVLELVITRAERLADLKEPLHGIHRYAHQSQESAESIGRDNRHHVENLMRLTLRMDSLLDSLLHFPCVGRMELDFEDTDLDAVFEEALEMIGAAACPIRS
jgi:chemotaxis family two-component system sensor kinase Cph1